MAMTTRTQSLRNGGMLLVLLGLLLVVVGGAMSGSGDVPGGITTVLIYLGGPFLLGGIVWYGLAITVREQEPAPMPQPVQQYYPPQV
jgi:hypothetical protein